MWVFTHPNTGSYNWKGWSCIVVTVCTAPLHSDMNPKLTISPVRTMPKKWLWLRCVAHGRYTGDLFQPFSCAYGVEHRWTPPGSSSKDPQFALRRQWIKANIHSAGKTQVWAIKAESQCGLSTLSHQWFNLWYQPSSTPYFFFCPQGWWMYWYWRLIILMCLHEITHSRLMDEHHYYRSSFFILSILFCPSQFIHASRYCLC